jgi:2-oxoglutarate decarboxylase
VATTDQSTGNEPSSAPADFGANEWLVEDMYERYLADPDSVDAAWHDFFADYRPGPNGSHGGGGAANGVTGVNGVDATERAVADRK